VNEEAIARVGLQRHMIIYIYIYTLTHILFGKGRDKIPKGVISMQFISATSGSMNKS
jgi:hypothetical protein